MILTFGKHHGRDISDVPESYLRWLLAEANITPALRAAIRLVLDGTTAAVPAKIAMERVIAPWRRELSRRYHPDHGGSHRDMVIINVAADLLELMVEAGAGGVA